MRRGRERTAQSMQADERTDLERALLESETARQESEALRQLVARLLEGAKPSDPDPSDETAFR